MTKARDIAGFPENLNIGEKTNLLTNGDFTTDTSNWTATTSTLSINSSRLQIIPDASVNGFANQQVDNLVVGRSYIASVDIIQDAGPFGRLYIGTSANGNQTVTSSNLGVGTHSFTFVATATTHHFALVVGGGTGQTTIFDNARLTEANTITFPAISGTSPSIRQGTSVNDLAIATNNINRFNITNDGYVIMPNQPAWVSYANSRAGWQSTTLQKVPYDTVIHSEPSGAYSTTNFRYTAPVAGRYWVQISQNGIGDIILYIYKNGSVYHAGEYRSNPTNIWEHYVVGTIVELSANDYLEAYVKLTTSTGYGWNGATSTWDQFSGFLIG